MDLVNAGTALQPRRSGAGHPGTFAVSVGCGRGGGCAVAAFPFAAAGAGAGVVAAAPGVLRGVDRHLLGGCLAGAQDDVGAGPLLACHHMAPNEPKSDSHKFWSSGSVLNRLQWP